MVELEDSSVDFYSMLRSVVNQKRQAELDEAFKQVAGRMAAGKIPTEPARPDPIVAPSWQVTVPKTKEQDLVANTFQSPDN